MPYEESWDRIHAPGAEADWQESDCYWFYDASAGVGGFHRIGQKPNRGTGQLTLFVFSETGSRFVINDSYTLDRPIAPDDRWADGHRIGSHQAQDLGGRQRQFSWEEKDSSADLTFYEDFYTPRGWHKDQHHGAAVLKNMNPDGHLECSGRLRGDVRIGEQKLTIDALAHRDRSWGFRDHSKINYHGFRMVSGTVGPALSFASFILAPKGQPPVVSGFVVRNGVEEDLVGLRAPTVFDLDGQTVLGATVTFLLESGEEVEITCETVQSQFVYFPEADAYISDNISKVTYKGHTGFCDLSVSTNPRQGSLKLERADAPLAAVMPGLSPSTDYSAKR